MHKKHIFRLSALILFLIGIGLLFGNKVDLAGAAIGVISTSSIFNYFLGIILIFGAIILFLAGDLEDKLKEEKNEDYYKRRVKELFRQNYNGQDVWVSRWELDGIMDYIKEGTDKKGEKLFSEYDFEHGKEAPAIHPLGSHKLLHMNVKVRDKYGNFIKRHLLITDDPYDTRLEHVGLDLESGKRIGSSVYSSQHPRTEKKVYKRRIDITYERK